MRCHSYPLNHHAVQAREIFRFRGSANNVVFFIRRLPFRVFLIRGTALLQYGHRSSEGGTQVRSDHECHA